MKNWTREDLIGLSGSYWAACALHAGVRLDVFSPLADGPLTLDVLVERVGCPARSLDMLLTALCALELLTRKNDQFELTAFAREALCKDAPGYVGYIIDHHHQLMPSWTQLDKSVQLNSPGRERLSFSDEECESFLMGMYDMASIKAAQAVQKVDLSRCARLLDLGGGTGAYAVHFCKANPELGVVVFDLPTSKPFAEKIITRHGFEQRIVFHAGDFIKDDLPGGFDAVWLSHILHGLGEEEAALVVRKAAGTLKPGGLLLIQEFVLDDSRDGPLFSSLFALNMLSGTSAGKAYTWNELTEMLQNAGVSRIMKLLESPDGSGILAGTAGTPVA